jgi:hypothetical protein
LLSEVVTKLQSYLCLDLEKRCIMRALASVEGLMMGQICCFPRHPTPFFL